jgi:very-short-patch-repair endonuclease
MSVLEDLLAEQLTREGIEFTREFKFLPDRKFRADFALIIPRILVEVQGGIWMDKGGHNTGLSLRRDYEKANLAQLAGWRYLQFTAEDVTAGRACDVILQLVLRFGQELEMR